MASHRPALAFIVPLLATALALSACAQGNLEAGQTPAAQPTAVAQAPAPQPAPEPQPMLAARPQSAAQPTPPPEPDPEPEEAMTRERASGMCWMRYDRGRASLDARMKLVDKCIDEKMRAGR
jgi:hypothetical protein